MISAERIRNLSPQQRGLLLQRLSDSTDAAAERQIVAYVVSRRGQAPNKAVLQESLRSRLPEFMVPDQFVFLPSLPRNSNGKIDRNALPAPKLPETKSQTALTHPRTETEAKLARIWSDVLKVEDVGIDDNFFRLGGHSLLALQVMARVRDTFTADLPLKTLFESPTIAGLAEALSRLATQPAIKPIVRISRRNPQTPFASDNKRSEVSNSKNSRFPQDT